eukprot:g3360.t1
MEEDISKQNPTWNEKDFGDEDRDENIGEESRFLGGSSFPEEDRLDEFASPQLIRKVLLFVTYAISIFIVSAPPTMYAKLSLKLGFNATKTLTLVGIQSLGTSTGKLYAGIFADLMGGRVTYIISILVISVLLFCIQYVETFGQLCAFSFLMEFLNCPNWPAHIRIVQGHYGKKRYPQGMWILSMSSRVGNVICTLVYGLLQNYFSLNTICILGGFVGIVGSTLAFCFHRDSHFQLTSRMQYTQRESPSLPKSMQSSSKPERSFLSFLYRTVLTYKRVLLSERGVFFFAAAPLMLSTVIKRSGQLIPTFLFATQTNLVTEGTAAQIAAVYQIGLASSVLVLGYVYGRVSGSNRMYLCCGLLLICGVSCVGLGFLSNSISKDWGSYVIKIIMLFLISFCVGAPYYIPIGIFSMKFGKEASGTTAALLDFFGYGFASLALIAIQPLISGGGGYLDLWLVLGGCGVLGIPLYYFLIRYLHNDEWVLSSQPSPVPTASITGKSNGGNGKSYQRLHNQER